MATGSHHRDPFDVLDGRYRLVAPLGSGGFGDVWRAEELLPDGAPFRSVALKLLRPDGGDASNWVDEAKTLASLRHPSLVTVYAAGLFTHVIDAPLDRPIPYVSMELLEGETLAARGRGPVAWRRVLRWARDAAAALDVIHASGVVHLDLKPANVFLTTDGALKLLDFGISRRSGVVEFAADLRSEAGSASVDTDQFIAAREALAATCLAPAPIGDPSAKIVVGTPGFMAPEVLEGAPASRAADAFALGVLVVELATGELPQQCPPWPKADAPGGAVAAWVDAIRAATLSGRMRDLSADPAGLPRGLVMLLDRLLALDPRQRIAEGVPIFDLFDEVWTRPHGCMDCPYPGLSPLDAKFEGALWGRDEDILRLGRELELASSLVLHGQRRTGKSSLALAGLVPDLARRGVGGVDDWRAVHVVLGADPDAALEAALVGVDVRLASAAFEDVDAFVEEGTIGLCLVLDDLERLLEHPAPRLLSFVERLHERKPRAVRVVATLDEEGLAPLLKTTSLKGVFIASLRYVGPPNIAAAEDIALGPARLSGVTLEGTRPVVHDVRGALRAGGENLPFVALALASWWSRSAAGAHLTGERWTEMGGVRGAISELVARTIDGLGDAERTLALELFLRSSTALGAKMPWPRTELVEAFGRERAEASRMLDRLEREALFVTRADVTALAHPSIAEHLPTLEAARHADYERWAFLERLLESSRAWSSSGQDSTRLWTRAELVPARVRANETERISPGERRFLAESTRRLRLRLLASTSVVVALLVAILGADLVKRAADAREADMDRARSEAEARAHVAEMLAKSKRTDDGYHRVAYLAEATAKGSRDGAIALDLAEQALRLPSAEFLTLEPVSAPTFAWGPRWLLADGPDAAITAVDFFPRSGAVIDVADLDADPESLRQFLHPRLQSFLPGPEPVVERVPLPYDTAFLTRASSGEVRLFRLNEKGNVVLAAVAPIRCSGAVRAAERAPVIACPTEHGVAAWDFRKPGEAGVARRATRASGLDISSDGRKLASIVDRTLVIERTSAEAAPAEVEIQAEAPIVLSRWSPNDDGIAVLSARALEVFDFDGSAAKRVVRRATEVEAARMRWDAGGLDVAVCAADGSGVWNYLREGGRSDQDVAPVSGRSPCDPPAARDSAVRIEGSRDARELARLNVSEHPIEGGFKLPDGRVVTRDLVLVRAAGQPDSVLRFSAKGSTGGADAVDTDASNVAVERSADRVAWQSREEVILFDVRSRRRILSRRGHLLRACSDGRFAAWQAEAGVYQVFDVAMGSVVGSVPREPGFVVGIDDACRTLFTQRLDGVIVGWPVRERGAGVVAGALAGYVYEAKASRAREARGSGFWLATSEGEIARLDTDPVRLSVITRMTAPVDALGDGPRAGEVLVSGLEGVSIASMDGRVTRVFERTGTAWEDVAISPDGASAILSSHDRAVALDLELREITASLALRGAERIAPWDEEGSVLLWGSSKLGPIEGTIVPRGAALAREVARQTSNLVIAAGRIGIAAR